MQAHQSLLLLLIFITSSLLPSIRSNRCPDHETLAPICECNLLQNTPITKCSRVDQLQLLKRVFWNTGDRPLVHLEVADSLINFFPADVLRDKSVRVLRFDGTTLVSLFEKDPEENRKFYELVLYKSKVLRGVQWSQLKNLRNLSHIGTEGVTIKHLGKDFVENIPTSLVLIKLHDTKISRLHDEAFSRLSQVNTIDMELGKLTTIKRSMFPSENVIERLSFRSQKISSLPNDIFSNMPKLQAVSLGDNIITTVSESVFKVLADKNVIVYLFPSPIVCDCKVQWAAHRSNWKLHAICESPDEIYGKKITSLGHEWGCTTASGFLQRTDVDN